MSIRDRLGQIRAAGTVLIISASLLAWSEAGAIVPARPSRMLVIRLRGSADPVLLNLRSAATAAGLRCDNYHPEQDPNPPLRCLLPAGKKGVLWANNLVEKKEIFIEIYSANVFTPQGEIDPQIEAALKSFYAALVGDLNITNLQECRASDEPATCVL